MVNEAKKRPLKARLGEKKHGVTLIDADKAIAQAEKSAEKAVKCLSLSPGPVWQKQVDYYRYASAFLKHLKTIVAQQNA